MSLPAQAVVALALLTGPPPAPTQDLTVIVDGDFASTALESEFNRDWQLTNLSKEIQLFYRVQFVQRYDVSGVLGPYPVAIVGKSERKSIEANGSGMALMGLHEFCTEQRLLHQASLPDDSLTRYEQEWLWREQWIGDQAERHPDGEDDDESVPAVLPW